MITLLHQIITSNFSEFNRDKLLFQGNLVSSNPDCLGNYLTYLKTYHLNNFIVCLHSCYKIFDISPIEYLFSFNLYNILTHDTQEQRHRYFSIICKRLILNPKFILVITWSLFYHIFIFLFNKFILLSSLYYCHTN